MNTMEMTRFRHCPNCRSDRSLEEVFCRGIVAGAQCNWDLSNEEIQSVGGARPQPEEARPIRSAPQARLCPNGHDISAGDVICIICGEMVVEDRRQEAAPATEGAAASEEAIDGWQLVRPLSTASAVRQRHLARRIEDGRTAVLTLYQAGAEPDTSVYDVIRRLPRDHVPEIVATGRWDGRAYEVAEELTGGTLDSFECGPQDIEGARSIAFEIGKALNSFREAGLRHRDLRPGNILLRSHDPLDLVIIGFGSARLSDFDLDIVSPLETTRYMAPEAIAGGVAAASDWWSLGMIILEKVTRGACFEGVNEQAFLIHVLATGVSIPEDVDPAIQMLLRGLLKRDRTKRWQWDEVKAWLAGEPVEDVGEGTSTEQSASGTTIALGGVKYDRPSRYALAAARPETWSEALEQLLRGTTATWLEEAGADPKVCAACRDLVHRDQIPDDFRLALVLKRLNREMPLVWRGEIVTPGWLLAHPAEGYELITGPVPDIVAETGEEWLSRLKRRAKSVREEAAGLGIDLDEMELQANLLSTSVANLQALWDERRQLFPDTNHPGLTSLIERRVTRDQDIVLLVSAALGQFRSVDEIIEEAARLAGIASVGGFDPEVAKRWLRKPRRELNAELDQRTEGFRRCGNAKVDEWVDQFRLERRILVERLLVALALPEVSWTEPPKQGYVSAILDFFAKRIGAGALKGSLARMVIGKTGAKVDLTELGTARVGAAQILDHLLSRSERTLELDPAAFSASETVERRLRSVYTHATIYKRDTGIDGLYLGFPFLLVGDSKGTAKPRIAPVLLWPVKVTPVVGNLSRFHLSFDRDREEVRLNPAFEALLGTGEAVRWAETMDELLGRAALKVSDVMDAFGTLVQARGRTLAPLPGKDLKLAGKEPELACSAVLFHLTYMGQAIMKDLVDLKSLQAAGTALETALRIRQEAPAPAAGRMREIERFFTADSDPSQEAAVLAARTTPGVLVEGPPGTGKSQTIVNIVADAIGRQKNVLIVCQKQAALDVVRKRLAAEGLENRLIMVVDVNKDRGNVIKSIREQLDRLDVAGGNTQAIRRQREQAAARLESLDAQLNAYHAAFRSSDEKSGHSYRSLISELIALDQAGETLDVPGLQAVLGQLDGGTAAEIQEECVSNFSAWLPAKWEGNALHATVPFPADQVSVRTAQEALMAFTQVDGEREDVVRRTSTPFEIPASAPYRNWMETDGKRLLDIMQEQRSDLAELLSAFKPAREGAEKGVRWLAELKDVLADLSSLEDEDGEERIVEALLRLGDSELGAWIDRAETVSAPKSFFSFLSLKRHTANKALHKYLKGIGAKDDDQSVTEFLKTARLERTVRPLRVRYAVVEKASKAERRKDGFGDLQSVVKAATSLIARLKSVQEMAKLVLSCPHADPLLVEEAVAKKSKEAIEELLRVFDDACERADARERSLVHLDALRAYMPEQWIVQRRKAITERNSNVGAMKPLIEALPTLAAFQRFRALAAKLRQETLQAFAVLRPAEAGLSAIPRHASDEVVRRIVRKQQLLAWKASFEERTPELAYDLQDLRSKVEALEKLDKEMKGYNRRLLSEGMDNGKLAGKQAWEGATRLTGQRARRLREFIGQATDLGLMELRPVWMMNPDVASRMLPLSKGLFDVVVYDEASQMPVEYALPTLYRAKTVVVSGDEKQMPPTAFFSSKVESDESDIYDGEAPDEDATDKEVEIFEENWNRREIKDCPDLLHLAREVLPTETLKIHYRSAYRELINFSNASFYNDELNVPVRHPIEEVIRHKPLELRHVAGLYEEQTNQKEADEVAELVSEIWLRSDGPTPSIGVVTFNRKQADLIEEVIDQRAETDAAFRSVYARELDRVEEGEDMGFFVKNVENVQGDERDVIIFSTTFGRNAQGTFRRSFGVLGQAGGERRLNVAVTRARKKVYVLTSMPIAAISDALSTKQRPSKPRDYLQGYLEYARTLTAGDVDGGTRLLGNFAPPTSRQDQDISQGADEDGFVRAVADFLTDLGYDAQRAADQKVFSLDFAIKDPRTGLYGFGIECDGAQHPLLESARSREVWRPKVLRHFVKNVHRISSASWYADPEGEKSRLHQALQASLGATAS